MSKQTFNPVKDAVACFYFKQGDVITYWTKENGKGNQIDTDEMRVSSAGRGLYFAAPKDLTDQEKKAFNSFVGKHRVNALASGSTGRVSKAMVSLDALIKMINGQYDWEKEQAEQVLSLLDGKLTELKSRFESYFSSTKTRKASVKGYDISL